MTDSLQARLYRRLDESPDDPALAFIDSEGRFDWLTVQESFTMAVRYGRGLLAKGCRPGDRCVLVLASDEECAMVLLGALLTGVVPLLVAPPVLQSSRNSALLSNLRHTLELVRPRVVVGDESIEGIWPEISRDSSTQGVFVPSSLAEIGGLEEPKQIAPGDTAALQLTSGTTGVPRVCRWEQRNVLAALDAMKEAMGLREDDVCFNWTPLYHDMGLVNNFFLCLVAGVPLAMLGPTDFVRRPGRWIRGMNDTRSTISWSPNFGFALAAERTDDALLEGVRLDHVRAIWNAAERIHVETMFRFHRRFSDLGLRFESLKTNFGCAENVGGATFSELEEPFRWEELDVVALQEERIACPVDESDSVARTEKIVSAGRPVPGMRIVITSSDGTPVPDGVVGEVRLDTPSRMAEYLGDPAATASALADGLLRTGDLGYVRNGELYWVGRVQERITVRGRKIDPSEFEALLFDIPDLRPGCFVAFGVPDPTLGTERPVLISEVRDSDRSLEEIAGDLVEITSRELGVVLHDVMLVRKGVLAKTSSGKRRHRHFREAYADGLPFLYSSRRGTPA